MRYQFLLLLGLGACGGRDLTSMHAAVDGARVKIGAAVPIAEGSMTNGRAITGALKLEDPPVYVFGTLGATVLHDVRIATQDGHIVATSQGVAAADPCPGSIPLTEAIAIAEARISGGTVIAIVPDDDVACAREVQVLAPDLIWEVKIAGGGEVLEVEESDENED